MSQISIYLYSQLKQQLPLLSDAQTTRLTTEIINGLSGLVARSTAFNIVRGVKRNQRQLLDFVASTTDGADIDTKLFVETARRPPKRVAEEQERICKKARKDFEDRHNVTK